MHNQLNSLATLNIGGGEIILILVILFILAVVAVVFFGLIYLLVRAVQNRPAPVPSTLAQDVLLQNQQKKDREHLRLLSIFHFVVAGLALFGIAFLFVHYFIMHTAFSNPDMWKGQQNAALPPKAFLDAFVWFYVFMGAIFLIGMGAKCDFGCFSLAEKAPGVFDSSRGLELFADSIRNRFGRFYDYCAFP